MRLRCCRLLNLSLTGLTVLLGILRRLVGISSGSSTSGSSLTPLILPSRLIRFFSSTGLRTARARVSSSRRRSSFFTPLLISPTRLSCLSWNLASFFAASCLSRSLRRASLLRSVLESFPGSSFNRADDTSWSASPPGEASPAPWASSSSSSSSPAERSSSPTRGPLRSPRFIRLPPTFSRARLCFSSSPRICVAAWAMSFSCSAASGRYDAPPFATSTARYFDTSGLRFAAILRFLPEMVPTGTALPRTIGSLR
mmetsp:Transcript_42729/g.101707  ORF Transcript_42729/g.101707 Transcript_42729/m.101707 type:complete len:255 (+) Transcript_42729:176-940(+)